MSMQSHVLYKHRYFDVEHITIKTLDGRWTDDQGQKFCVEAVFSNTEPAIMNILPWEKV